MKTSTKNRNMMRLVLIATIVTATLPSMPATAQSNFSFATGDIVVSVEGNGVNGAGSGPYTDNQAAPLTLFQFATAGTSSASFAGSLVLPQVASGSNYAISGEYGSSSEGTLQLSGNGQYLTIMGYGVNAAAFNANPTAYGTSVNDPTKPTALGQSGSLTGQSYTAVPRVVALIAANGSVDTSTALYGVFNGNNPRSAYTVNGTSFYVSGQGVSGDNTGGVFYAVKGSTSATSITGADAGSGASQDTREVQAYNGQLYVSADSKSGSTNRSFIGTLGSSGSLPTSVANSGNGPTQLLGTGTSTGKLTITAATSNGINSAGQQINLSPENFFFANASTLYIADSGSPKNTSATSSLGDGGLQKWVNSKADGTGTWTLEYTISSGLNLVANTATSGTTGLLGLAGEVVGNSVELFATNYTVGDTDPTYLFGFTDILSATTLPSSGFSVLAAAPVDSNFKGVSLAPVPEPATYELMLCGLGLLGLIGRRRTRRSGGMQFSH